MISTSPANEKELLELCFSQPWFSSDFNVIRLPNDISVAAMNRPHTDAAGHYFYNYSIVEIAALDTVAIFRASGITALLNLLISIQGKTGPFWCLQPIVLDRALKFIVHETKLDRDIVLAVGDRRTFGIDRHLLGTALMLSLIWLLLRSH